MVPVVGAGAELLPASTAAAAEGTEDAAARRAARALPTAPAALLLAVATDSIVGIVEMAQGCIQQRKGGMTVTSSIWLSWRVI